MQNLENYSKILENTRSFYEKIGRVRCPALNNEYVHFNSEGFTHLLYKNKTPRTRNEILTKLKLVTRARDIVAKTTTYQEYDEALEMLTLKKMKRKSTESCIVKYWGIVAIHKERRLKVVIRQIGNGQKNFYSVIPCWSTSQYRDIKMVSNFKGNPHDD